MKKLVLLAIVATFATSAFAQKGLVELQGCFDGTCDTLDFDHGSVVDGDFNSDADDDVESQNIALNYNHLINDNFGLGIVYRQSSKTVDGDIQAENGDNLTTTGLNFFYNFDGGWMGSYAALRYWMTSTEESDLTSAGAANTTDDSTERTDIVLEYGKRVALGKAMGVSFAWNPSVSYTMSTTSRGESGSDDSEATSISIQPVNFAVAF